MNTKLKISENTLTKKLQVELNKVNKDEDKVEMKINNKVESKIKKILELAFS